MTDLHSLVSRQPHASSTLKYCRDLLLQNTINTQHSSAVSSIACSTLPSALKASWRSLYCNFAAQTYQYSVSVTISSQACTALRRHVSTLTRLIRKLISPLGLPFGDRLRDFWRTRSITSVLFYRLFRFMLVCIGSSKLRIRRTTSAGGIDNMKYQLCCHKSIDVTSIVIQVPQAVTQTGLSLMHFYRCCCLSNADADSNSTNKTPPYPNF